MFRSALALVLAPGAALTLRGLIDAVWPSGCVPPFSAALHAAAAAGLLVAVVLTVLAWTDWVAGGGPPGSRDSQGRPRRRFLAILAIAVAALSGLAIVALWLGAWGRSPCTP